MRRLVLIPMLGLLAVVPAHAEDSQRILAVDHYVTLRSTAPSILGQTARLYVRERVLGGVASRGGAPVALFIHGAGTPTVTSFDPPVDGYSWMEHLARAGFDVFALDFTGYGRSTRTPLEDDPCSLSAAQGQQLGFTVPCAPAVARPMLANMASDWDDINAVVDHLRRLRGVSTVDLVAWSRGGIRAVGYVSKHPEKVRRMVLLAPAYNRAAPDTPPPSSSSDPQLLTQSHDEFFANWDRQVGCPAQYEPAVAGQVWASMLAEDPVGATWGPGVRRSPADRNLWGINAAVAARIKTPTLLISGGTDKTVDPARVRELFADLGSDRKVFADLACSSHNAMWERNRQLLFDASLQWLTSGQLKGSSSGEVRLGY